MSTVTEVRAFRGVARLSFDDAAPLKVRLKHFKALPLAAGDDVDVEEYSLRLCRSTTDGQPINTASISSPSPCRSA